MAILFFSIGHLRPGLLSATRNMKVTAGLFAEKKADKVDFLLSTPLKYANFRPGHKSWSSRNSGTKLKFNFLFLVPSMGPLGVPMSAI